jgi:drug/metabolite transporter (DMT)-like permease
VGLALFALYVIWGSTYFAMHVALGFLPPFLMAGPRFLAAGSILFVILRLRGESLPSARQWAASGLIGVLLLVCGNGFVAIAQRSIDSGVAATVVAAMPLWAAAIGGVWGDRPTLREVLGLLLGFAGVAVLKHGGSLSLWTPAGLLLMIAPISWAFGSLLGRRILSPAGAMSSAAQMIVAGSVMLTISLARGDRPVGPPTVSGIGAVVYLIVFGSLVGFSAYGYLLRATRPAIATSYAYVNPVIALILGAALGGEEFTAAKALACALTIVGVVIVTLPRAAMASVE